MFQGEEPGSGHDAFPTGALMCDVRSKSSGEEEHNGKNGKEAEAELFLFDTLRHPPTTPVTGSGSLQQKNHSPRPPIYYIFVASLSLCTPVCLLNGGEMLPLHTTSETVERECRIRV